MLTPDTLPSAIKKVLSQINDGEYPQAFEYLDGLLEDLQCSESTDITPYNIASVLVNCDKPKKLPFFLIEFISDLYQYEIENGNGDAMAALGGQYYDGGRGFVQSFSKAVELYKAAIEHGNGWAYECLGYCYYYGRHMEPDYEKAFKCFSHAALAGSLESLYRLGDMYLRGQYVDKDEREAFIIYNRCNQMIGDNGNDHIVGPVHLRLGSLFLDGIGTNPDPESALFHYNLAEIMLYRMVKDGNYMYKKSLRLAIEGQAKARALLANNIPKDEWIDEAI